jgi:CRISPR/Cas system-associated exonuclease Cas4 (RecB family)
MRYKLRHVDGIKEPDRGPDNPMERGNRIHENLENYVKGKCTLEGNEAKRLAAFTPALEHLQTLYAAGNAIAEDNWFYDTDWCVTDRANVDLWVKLDFFVEDPARNVAVVGDYKSGKSNFKAIEHTQQTTLYAAAAALRYPAIDWFYTELWYVDEGHVKQHRYSREAALRYVQSYSNRVARLRSDKLFRPNASVHNCRYCPYSPRELGVCPVGV